MLVIHVYETPILFTSEMPYTAVEAAEKIAKDESTDKLEKLSIEIKKNNPQLEYDLILRKGLTPDLVCDLCTEHNVDLLITGSTGAGVVERTLIGSTTTAFINNTTMPVLVIPPESSYTPIERITYTSDLKDENIKQIEKILPLANHKMAEISVLFVDNTIHSDAEKFSEIMKEKLRKNISYPKLSAYICTDPNIMNGISIFIKENKSNMVCMLTHKRKFPFMLWDSSVTKKFSYHPDIPLLVLHAD